MSSVTRIMSGLPLEYGTKAVTKVKGDRKITIAKMPDGTTEISVVQKTLEGLKLLKAIFRNEKTSTILYPEKSLKITTDRRTGQSFVAKA